MSNDNRKYLYWNWVSQEAKSIDSDGCSFASELFHTCCLEHDLYYRYKRIPMSAYAFYLASEEGYWQLARKASRREADAQFRLCIQNKSWLGKWSPVAWARWVGVRVGGWFSWNRKGKDNA